MPSLLFHPTQPFLSGEYRLTTKLGEGGMSQVWEAVELFSGNRVAIKMLHDPGGGFAERFRRECVFYTQLRHPNVVRMLRAGVTSPIEGSVMYLVMDRVHGITLRRAVDKVGRMKLLDALALMFQLADTMAYVHRAGIWHRDLKPENLLVDTSTLARGRLWLLDFGISKFADPKGLHGLKGTDDMAQVATNRYMSPEQAKDRTLVDGRSDIYAFGFIFYELVTGEHPFIDKRRPMSAPAIVKGHLSADIMPIPLRVPGFPEAAWRVVARCIARDPALRHQSFDEVKQAIRGLVPDTLPPDHDLAKRLAEVDLRAACAQAFDRMVLDAGPMSAEAPSQPSSQASASRARSKLAETAPLPDDFAGRGSATPFPRPGKPAARKALGQGHTERMPAVVALPRPSPTIDEAAPGATRALLLPAAPPPGAPAVAPPVQAHGRPFEMAHPARAPGFDPGDAAAAERATPRGPTAPAVELPLRPTAPMTERQPRTGASRRVVVAAVCAAGALVTLGLAGALVLRGDGDAAPAGAPAPSALARPPASAPPAGSAATPVSAPAPSASAPRGPSTAAPPAAPRRPQAAPRSRKQPFGLPGG